MVARPGNLAKLLEGGKEHDKHRRITVYRPPHGLLQRGHHLQGRAKAQVSDPVFVRGEQTQLFFLSATKAAQRKEALPALQ